jgi:hypothetical protein
MRRLSDLGFLFGVVAAVEAVYALTALLTPPGQVEAVTGWVMWLVLADEHVFSTALGQALVIISIPTHYGIGLLLALRSDARRPHMPARKGRRRSRPWYVRRSGDRQVLLTAAWADGSLACMTRANLRNIPAIAER